MARFKILLCAALTSLTASVAAGQTPPQARFRFVNLTPASFENSSEIVTRQSTPLVDRAANRLVYLERSVHIWVDCSPQLDQFGFEIFGLVDPDLEFVAGAQVTFELLNWGLFNGESFIVTNKAPPYSGLQPESEGPWGHLYNRKPLLAPRIFGPQQTPGPVNAVVLVYEFTGPGDAYYLNNAIRYATMGSWGRITVVP